MAHPQIAVFARLADANEPPVRRIQGQRSLLTRTMHAIHYNEKRDEIVVPNQFAQAILTFRGDAAGEATPVRIIQGSRTKLRGSSGVVVDVENDEIITERQVFPMDANGNVEPIRTMVHNVDAVDNVNDFYIGTRGMGDGAVLQVFDRTANKPEALRTIGGPRTMLIGPNRMRVYNGWIVVAHDGEQHDEPNNLSFVGIWSVFDEGDVPPRWSVGGPHQKLRKPRGVDIDAKNQTIIVSDKELNAALTYSIPEMFRAPASPSR